MHTANIHPRWPRILAWVTALAGCAAVFSLYTHPEVLLSLADQLWACF